MINDPKSSDTHDILVEMDDAHEEQPGEPAQPSQKEKVQEAGDAKTEHAPRLDD